MKKGWVETKLGDVCTLQRGFDLPKGSRTAGDFPLVSSSGIIDTHDIFKVKAPGVATGRSGSIGNVFYIENDYWPLNTVLYVKDFHGNDARFVYYLLTQFNLGKFSSGVGVPTLNRNFVHDELVSIPTSVPEQQRIVSVLDEAFASIAQAKANAERNLVNARELFGSYLESLFADSRKAWEEKKLGEVCERITDGTHVTPKYVPEGVPFLSVKNLTKGFIDFSDTRFISPEEHKILTKRVRPERDDVLYTKVGTTGVAQVVDVDVEFSIFVSVALLKLKHEMIFNKYLEFFLNSPFARRQAQKRTRGMANKNLVITDIKEIEIHFPKSLAEQRAIVGRLEALSAETKRLEEIYQSKLEALDELRRSMLARAFEGEI